MRLYPISLLLITGLLACNTAEKPQRVSRKDTTTHKASQELAETMDEAEYEEYLRRVYSPLRFNISGLTISFDSLGEFNENLLESAGDTLYYPIDYGDRPTTMVMNPGTGEMISVLQQHRSVMAIDHAWGQCTLDEWKRYDSPWKTLRSTPSGDVLRFKAFTVTPEELKVFTEYTNDELLIAVDDHCGEDLVKGLVMQEKAQGDTLYFRNPIVSEFMYRIAIHHKSGDSLVKYLVLKRYLGPGC